MATVIIPNQPLSTAYVNNSSAALTDLYFVMWKLTRAMKKAGWTYKASSTAATKDSSGVAANDLWGTNADPTTDLYSAFGGASAWWVGQGPSTLKIPIGSASTGTFIRGEDISQATTGAHGELLGYLWDIPTNQGYLVVAPRVDGTGGDPHGWNHVNTITGAISGATITPNATVKEYVREVVFWKNNVANSQINGNIYYQCVDATAEATSRFSYLAANAGGCTFSIAPGGGGLGNFFPSVGSFVVIGASAGPNISTTSVGSQTLPISTFNVTSTTGFPTSGFFEVTSSNGVQSVSYTGITSTSFTGCTSGSGTVSAGSTVAYSPTATWPNRWTNHSSGLAQNQCHIVALNATHSSLTSADGSFWTVIGAPTTLGTDNGVYDGIVFSITDNAEPGDIDPYVWYMPTNDSTYSTTGYIGSQSGASGVFCAQPNGSTNNVVYRMLRNRGAAIGDSFINSGQAMLVQGGFSSYSFLSNINTADRETLACTFTTTYLAEDIWVICSQPYYRCNKGTLRWMKSVAPGGNASGTDTFGGLSWIQVSNVTATNVGPPFILGPWDGSTIPISTHV